MTRQELDLTADVIDVRDIIERIEELEMSLDGENTDDDTRGDILEEIAALEEIMEDLKGNGGDEQWRGDWYPVTLIRESHFVDYCQELVFDCYDLKGIPTFIHIDWELTARELKVDYSEVTIDGVTYFYR